MIRPPSLGGAGRARTSNMHRASRWAFRMIALEPDGPDHLEKQAAGRYRNVEGDDR